MLYGHPPTTPGHIAPMLHGSPSVLHVVQSDWSPEPVVLQPQRPSAALTHESDVTPMHVAGDVTQHRFASLFSGGAPESPPSDPPAPPPHAASSTTTRLQGLMILDRSTPREGGM